MGDTISSLVFRPPTPTPIRRSRYFWMETQLEDGSKGRIPAFFIKRRGANLTILFSHGNAEDLGMMFSRMKDIALVFRVNVLAYDYSGYGKSSGSVSEANCYYNIEAAYKYLVEGRGIQPEQIVLYGRSLGSGPTCYLAAKTAASGRSVGGVILHSPFLSIYRIVIDTGFTVTGDMFANIDKGPKIKCPVLIVHGTEDEIVPFWHAQELLNSMPPTSRVRPLWAQGLGHNSIEVYMRNEYVATIKHFLSRYIAASGGDIVPPSPVPVREQPDENYSASCFVKVNPVWIRHGATMLNEVMSIRNYDEQRMTEGSQRADDDTDDFTYREEDNKTIGTEKTMDREVSTREVLAKGRQKSATKQRLANAFNKR